MTPAEVEKLLESTGAIRRGHFQLSSGLHSPIYVQCALLFQHPVQTSRLADALAQLFAETPVDVVAAPALGGIVLGYELARQLGARAVFVERDSKGRMALRRFPLKSGERVLVAEDVLTTGGSTSETLAVIRRAGGTVVGVAAVLDRSGGVLKLDVPLRTLLAQKLETFAAADCPLCRAGQPVEKPGSRPEA
ncbi:MAG: orotate phosphoribosyltransferase [Acidobacteria bacterium]|nr:orotate phosphoribosyltransferase [Acidobacteriota bacterium]